MPENCTSGGCKAPVPAGLEEDCLCLLHFTLLLEQNCAKMRRETTMATASKERQQEIVQYIAGGGERLARVATSGIHLTDEIKARVLSTFLTLMNFRENLDRALQRQASARTFGR
jgi:hypothetical protein